jgi:hypothetical protein
MERAGPGQFIGITHFPKWLNEAGYWGEVYVDGSDVVIRMQLIPAYAPKLASEMAVQMVEDFVDTEQKQAEDA